MTAIRIGDAERDAAVSALGEHYAAGRLTKQEYDERADRVTAARFDDDLAPMFSDLPSAPRRELATSSASSTRRRRPHLPALGVVARALPALWFAPLLMIAAIALVAAVAVSISPWLLFALLWFACAGPGRSRRARQHWNRQQWHGAQWSSQWSSRPQGARR